MPGQWILPQKGQDVGQFNLRVCPCRVKLGLSCRALLERKDVPGIECPQQEVVRALDFLLLPHLGVGDLERDGRNSVLDESRLQASWLTGVDC